MDIENNVPSSLKIAGILDATSIKRIAYDTWYDAYGAILTEDQITFMLEELYDESVISELINSKEQEFLIIFKKKLPVGFASYSTLNEEVMKLCKIYVLPEVQGMGLGDKLMAAVKENASRAKFKYIELNVNRSNRALNYYIKRGFKIVREVDIPIGAYWMNDYVMRCPIEA